MEAQASKMQLSSFLGQLAQMIAAQSQSIENVQATIDEIEEGTTGPQQLLSLGAFAALYISETDRAISKAASLVNRAIDPLPLEKVAEDIAPFDPGPRDDFSEQLEKALDRNKKWTEDIIDLEKSLLALSDKEIRSSYPRKSLQDFTRSWENQFEHFFREES